MASQLKKVGGSPLPTPISTTPKTSETEKMMAVVFHGKRSVKVECVPKPLTTDTRDAVVRITLTTICSTDLHLYHNLFPGMQKGDILGHEAVGVVESIGESVHKIEVGDRVVISSPVSCGECDQCTAGCYNLCQRTNPSREMFNNLGHHRVTGVFGCGQNMGGYPGMQAQYIRVPYADTNLLKIPQDLRDDQAIFLSDVVPTAWHAVEMGEVGPGKVVAVWGCGPIGLMCIKLAMNRTAKRVIGIDCQPSRLKIADHLGAEIINYKDKDPVEALAEMVPGGPDVCIDSVGFRYSKTLRHTIESAIGIEADVAECLDECIRAVKVGGHVSVIGDYVGYTNHFPIGIMMSKGLTMRSGMQYAQKYWQNLLKMMRAGEIDPTFMSTHMMPLEKAEEAYEIFDKKQEECVKIMLCPPTHTC